MIMINDNDNDSDNDNDNNNNTVEPRYFEVSREMEKSSKQRGFEITGEA